MTEPLAVGPRSPGTLILELLISRHQSRVVLSQRDNDPLDFSISGLLWRNQLGKRCYYDCYYTTQAFRHRILSGIHRTSPMSCKYTDVRVLDAHIVQEEGQTASGRQAGADLDRRDVGPSGGGDDKSKDIRHCRQTVLSERQNLIPGDAPHCVKRLFIDGQQTATCSVSTMSSFLTGQTDGMDEQHSPGFGSHSSSGRGTP